MKQEEQSKMEKLLPYVDNLMLTTLKIQQLRNRGQLVPTELDNLKMSQMDELTERWINSSTDILNSLNLNQ